jgi:iron complex transport system substrate-binding protein
MINTDMINTGMINFRRRLLGLAATTTAVVVLLAGCGSQPNGSSAGAGSPGRSADGCISSFDPNKDYFADKQQLRYAKNFDISYHKSYQVITVEQPTVGGKPESYVLLKCGAPKPKLTGELAEAPLVTTPVKSIFSSSTTHIPSLEALGKLDLLTGVASKALISSEAARKRVAGEHVTEYAPAGTANAEKIVAEQPDVLITGGLDDPAHATVRQAGIPVLADAEYLEPSPLGTAEWIKYFAALTGTEKRAAGIFSGIAADYDVTVQQVADAEPVPVLLSQPYQGVWSMPTGGSPMGKMITDAGGTWPWQDDPSAAAKQTDLETVYQRAGSSKVWITSMNWTTRNQAAGEEPRFAEFAAYKSGQVWAPSLQVNEGGGNNVYELGVLRPDLVIADLAAILHPDVVPDHEFTFYQKLS